MTRGLRFPQRRRRRSGSWGRSRGGAWSGLRKGRHALVWLVAAALASLFAPALDDARSWLQPMKAGCEVTRVVDGDTVDIACDGRTATRGRLTGFDTPELFSPRCAREERAARAAREALVRMVQGRKVEAAFLGTDRYGRALVDLRVGGARVAARMIAAGHGRRYDGGRRKGWC